MAGARLEELKAALAAVTPGPALDGAHPPLGFFPNPHSPRVFWCGIEAPGLESLAAETDRATAALGIPSEKRAFSPHLTLARIKDTRVWNLQPLREPSPRCRRSISATSQAPAFFLYQSRLQPIRFRVH